MCPLPLPLNWQHQRLLGLKLATGRSKLDLQLQRLAGSVGMCAHPSSPSPFHPAGAQSEPSRAQISTRRVAKPEASLRSQTARVSDYSIAQRAGRRPSPGILSVNKQTFKNNQEPKYWFTEYDRYSRFGFNMKIAVAPVSSTHKFNIDAGLLSRDPPATVCGGSSRISISSVPGSA